MGASTTNKTEGTGRSGAHPWAGYVPGLLLILSVICVLSRYACELNTQFYQTRAPFFDSASYGNKMAMVWGATRTRGVMAGVREAFRGSTAPLPDLQAIVLMKLPFLGPQMNRCVPIVLQSIWLSLLGIALFTYFCQYQHCNQWISAALSMPFLTFAQMFSFNGGLSDFRLDLTLYIFVSITLVVYLITEETNAVWPWLTMGVCVVAASLERATAPVYLTVMLGPVWVVRLLRTKNRRDLMRKCGMMVLPVILIAGPYWFYNWSYLYYYYAKWNADANAKLPVSTSWRHLLFGVQHVGPGLMAALLAFAIVVGVETAFREGWKHVSIREWNWRFAYWGSAPLGMLVLRGAGLNQFVSMPAVFGIVMFAILPLKKGAVALRGVVTQVALVGVLAACGWNAAGAVGRHAPKPEVRMSALKAGIELMRDDARARGAREISFATTHIWNFHVAYLQNVLLMDLGGMWNGREVVTPDGVGWRTPAANLFGAAVPVVWEEIPGGGDEAKMEWLSRTAEREVDYMFLPTLSTIDALEHEVRYNYINLKVRAIRARLLQGGTWRPLGPVIAVTDQEAVQLYANQKRTGSPQIASVQGRRPPASSGLVP